MTRLRSPIRQRGAATIRWERWQDKCRKAVQLRSLGRCEACGENMRPLEWAHLAGRNNKGIGEPWASHPALTAGLCTSGYGHVGCHEKIDRGLDGVLLDRLRTEAIWRLTGEFGLTWGGANGVEPLDSIRRTVDFLERLGWHWNGEAIVKE